MLKHAPKSPSGVGLAKDGRPILSPYSRKGKVWSSKGVDVCNMGTVKVSKDKFFDKG